jgi:sarcosine oxidase subunit delta
MKILHCPLNGPRPVSEFAYGGEVRSMPDPAVCSDAEWADYVFNRSGVPGIKREWWCHLASGYWFIAERDTTRDVVVATFAPDLLRSPPPNEVRGQ